MAKQPVPTPKRRGGAELAVINFVLKHEDATDDQIAAHLAESGLKAATSTIKLQAGRVRRVLECQRELAK
jgi:hypothetical protein